MSGRSSFSTHRREHFRQGRPCSSDSCLSGIQDSLTCTPRATPWRELDRISAKLRGECRLVKRLQKSCPPLCTHRRRGRKAALQLSVETSSSTAQAFPSSLTLPSIVRL